MSIIISLVALFLSTLCCNTNSSGGTTSNSMGITLPPGFHISIYADNIEGARSMALSPDGVLFVGTRGEGKVYAILDTNKDYKET